MLSYTQENIFSVSEINNHLKNVIDNNIPNLYIEGEIANFVHHRSGHMYFSLKDENSYIKAVFFARQNIQLMFKPKNGNKVICFAKVTVYTKIGQYQLQVNSMFKYGKGKLYLQFEALKQKLDEQGLFLDEHKKNIPKYPKAIGIVTSKDGAALQDIKNVLNRRMNVDLYVYPANVQGKNAAVELTAGINFFSNFDKIDTIIIARGGGSQEDLFCFNDEVLAQAIYSCKKPVISGVGHEIDFSICDFVADLRAATPSAAAELATKDKNDVLQLINNLNNKAIAIIDSKVNRLKQKFDAYNKRLALQHPKKLWQQKQQQLDFLTIRLLNSKEFDKNAKYKYLNLNRALQNLYPLAPILKGFTTVYKNQKQIKSVTKLSKDDEIVVCFKDGNALCDVKNMEIKNK